MTKPSIRKWFGGRGEEYPIPVGSLAICLNCSKPFAKVIKQIEETDLRSDGYESLRYLNGARVLSHHPYFMHPKCENKSPGKR